MHFELFIKLKQKNGTKECNWKQAMTRIESSGVIEESIIRMLYGARKQTSEYAKPVCNHILCRQTISKMRMNVFTKFILFLYQIERSIFCVPATKVVMDVLTSSVWHKLTSFLPGLMVVLIGQFPLSFRINKQGNRYQYSIYEHYCRRTVTKKRK